MEEVPLDLAADLPVVKNPPTELDLRRFNKEFTTRILPTVVGCGHKFSPHDMPRNHCETCFFAYFNQDGERILTLNDEYKADKEQMIKVYGKTFVKYFERFMATVVKWQKEQEQEGQNG